MTKTKPRALPQSWQRAAQVSLLPDGAALGVFGGSRARYGAISDSSGDAIRAEFAGRAIRPQRTQGDDAEGADAAGE